MLSREVARDSVHGVEGTEAMGVLGLRPVMPPRVWTQDIPMIPRDLLCQGVAHGVRASGQVVLGEDGWVVPVMARPHVGPLHVADHREPMKERGAEGRVRDSTAS